MIYQTVVSIQSTLPLQTQFLDTFGSSNFRVSPTYLNLNMVHEYDRNPNMYNPAKNATQHTKLIEVNHLYLYIFFTWDVR